MIKKGRGIAGCIYSLTVTNTPNPCSAYMQMRQDGSVNVQIGICEIGQGSHTTLAMIIAEELTIPVETVSIYSADTSVTPYDFGTVSSRGTFAGGRAVLDACSQIKEALFHAAAHKMKTRADRLSLKDGMVVDKYDSRKKLPIAEAARVSQNVMNKLPMGMGEFHPFNVPVTVDGIGEPSDSYYYHATVAEVEVDTETGVVDVKKLYAALDCGKAINPMAVEGQIEGGAMQGLGWALREDMYPYGTGVDGESEEFDPDFRPVSLADYPIVTSMDTPEIVAAIVETHDGEGPFGAKAAGEICANTAAPAIINAIHDAVGVWITDLPATPEKVLRLLKSEKPPSVEGGGTKCRGLSDG